MCINGDVAPMQSCFQREAVGAAPTHSVAPVDFVVDYNSPMPRERIHPEGTDATYRVQESLKALVQLGGARKTFRLKSDANKALQQLVKMLDAATETEAVESAIIAMRDQMRADVVAKRQRQLRAAIRLVK